MTKTKPKYNLTVQIGKKDIKDKVYKFKDTTDPVKDLLSINIPKMMEGVTVTLEKDGLVAQRSFLSFKGRQMMNNKLHAFHLIKTMHWIMKPSVIKTVANKLISK